MFNYIFMKIIEDSSIQLHINIQLQKRKDKIFWLTSYKFITSLSWKNINEKAFIFGFANILKFNTFAWFSLPWCEIEIFTLMFQITK